MPSFLLFFVYESFQESKKIFELKMQLSLVSICYVPPLFNNPEVLPTASLKSKLFAENLSTNSNLYDSGITLTVFPL